MLTLRSGLLHHARRYGNAALGRLLDTARQVLGPCELAEDRTWEHGLSSVLRIRDASGVTWFLKAHRDRERYRAELAAYRHWVPALYDKAPRLRAFDGSLPAIILSAVPGELASWPAATADGPDADVSAERLVQHEAGKTLRLLHSAHPGLPCADLAIVKIKEFDSLRPSAAGLLRTRELDYARAQIEALADIPAHLRVPCHHDYTPRNWLVDNGTLYVIDFEWSGMDLWVADLARLHLGIWADRPDLRMAFLAGYGRELSDADHRALHACAVLTAVWLVVRAHETRQPSFEDASRTALLRLIDRAP
jgi:Ser/Thr protein kinase RdoA (MazF antagonist)